MSRFLTERDLKCSRPHKFDMLNVIAFFVGGQCQFLIETSHISDQVKCNLLKMQYTYYHSRCNCLITCMASMVNVVYSKCNRFNVECLCVGAGLCYFLSKYYKYKVMINFITYKSRYICRRTLIFCTLYFITTYPLFKLFPFLR